MKCTNCGHEMPDGAKFCKICGAPADIDRTQSVSGESDHISDNESDYVFSAFEDDGKEPPRRRRDDRDHRPRKESYRNGRYREEPPRNNKKKALIISIIALVLVIAILAGVIIIVNHNTVSAKELKEAKESYLPPAQAVQIDTSLDDPSNDRITFKYDDRARIISCTYTANEKTYDQSYTYDDALRNIHIETAYKQHLIFTKDIDYDKVSTANTFEAVEGYYIRLDDRCMGDESDASSSKASETAVPETEEPTDEPTEEPTEEPTDSSSDWKELYIDYLDSVPDYHSGKLFYLNDDSTPELALDITAMGASTRAYRICWISNGEVQTADITAMSGGAYQERSGILKAIQQTAGGSKGFETYSFDGINFTKIQSGFYVYNQDYQIDSEVVSEEEFNAARDTEGWDNINENTTGKEALPDYIRNY